MSEERAPYESRPTGSAGEQPEPRHFLVTLARDARAVKGPIYIYAVSHISAARIAYDELKARDSDELLVWTLAEFDQNKKPVAYAAGNLRFNQPINPQLERACFNCEGMMARTDHPEPGWYCGQCDTFLPDDQTKPRPGL